MGFDYFNCEECLSEKWYSVDYGDENEYIWEDICL
jgi:predicted metal-dependent hydrolase